MPEALAALDRVRPRGVGRGQRGGDGRGDRVGRARGEVTQAVRDSNSEAGPIRTGDWMGIVKGDGIATVAGSVLDASTQLLDQLIGDDGELLTIITGSDADSVGHCRPCRSGSPSDHADVQIELHRGGQPLYPYLFGVE